MLPIGLCAQLACVWEATARKPGNVHRYQDFNDTSYLDYLASAAAIAPVLDTAWKRSVGETVLAAVLATRQVTCANTNLGIILLLAPLASAAGETLRDGIRNVLERIDVQDATLVYEAIRLVHPAGLGKADSQDVSESPTRTLREVMTLAADRDRVAYQYATGFAQVFDEIVPALWTFDKVHGSIEESIVRTQLQLLAASPDSLIARKRGLDEANVVRAKARLVVQGQLARAKFDAWLREDGHTRNPGTTADLIAAGLFVALREGHLSPHARFSSDSA